MSADAPKPEWEDPNHPLACGRLLGLLLAAQIDVVPVLSDGNYTPYYDVTLPHMEGALRPRKVRLHVTLAPEVPF